MKKISWVTADYFVETDIHTIPLLLDKYNIEWYIVSANVNNDFQTELDILDANNDNLGIHKVYTGTSIFSLSSILLNIQLLKMVTNNKSEIVYSSILNFPYIPLSIFYYHRKNTIFAAHNVHVPKGVSHPILTKMYQSFALRWYKNYQTFSHSQFELLKKTYKRKNVFYAPFVLKDYGKSIMIPDEGVITFLNFGRIRGYKCIDVLIRASERVYELTNKKFKIIIAGECNEWQNYQTYIKHPNLFELHINNIPNDQVPILFARTHYTVLPYQDIAQSGALMVCINYNKPSILSKLPAFEEILTDGRDSLFIEPANEDQLVDRMLFCIEHHIEIYQKLVDNLNQMKANQFSKEAIAGKYIEFIDNI